MLLPPTALPPPPEESVSSSKADEVRRTRADAGLRTRMVSLEERVQALHKEVVLLREGLHTAARVVPGHCLFSPAGTPVVGTGRATPVGPSTPSRRPRSTSATS